MTTTTTRRQIETLGELLAHGALAVMRRTAEEARCACGCRGTWDRTVGGTVGGKPAVWMSCRYRSGSAIDPAVVEHYHAVHQVLDACYRLGVSADDAVATTRLADRDRFSPCDAYEGPLALAHERELWDRDRVKPSYHDDSYWHGRMLWQRGMTAAEVTAEE